MLPHIPGRIRESGLRDRDNESELVVDADGDGHDDE